MRVLIVNDHLEPEHVSVVRLAREQARELSARGYEVLLVGTTADDRQTGERAGEAWREIRLLSFFPARFRDVFGMFNPWVIPKFRQILASFQPEIAHFHNVHSQISFLAVHEAAESGARTFLTAHDVMLFRSGKLTPYDVSTTLRQIVDGEVSYRTTWRGELASRRLRWIPLRRKQIQRMTKAARILAVSEILQGALRQNDYSSTVLRNALTPESLDVEDARVAEFRSRFALGDGPVLLFGGRLSALKGDEQMLEAFAKLPQPDARLLVFGGGSRGWESAFDKRARRLGVADRVVRTGWLTGDDLRCAYSVCDVAVNPSLCFETLSMFNLEASAAQRPVVSTFFGGASETIDDGETGRLVNPYDVDALSVAIQEVFDLPDRGRALGAAGREKVRREFSPEASFDRLFDLYTEEG